jgi:hypothetical protein
MKVFDLLCEGDKEGNVDVVFRGLKTRPFFCANGRLVVTHDDLPGGVVAETYIPAEVLANRNVTIVTRNEDQPCPKSSESHWSFWQPSPEPNPPTPAGSSDRPSAR